MGRGFLKTVAAAITAALVAGVTLSARPPQGAAAPASALDAAQHLFYSGKYVEAIAATAPLRDAPASALSAYELRTSALHFRIKRLLGTDKDKEAAFKKCQACPDLLKEFMADVTAGRVLAREGLKSAPRDEALLYLLAKLDLNEVWLNNSTLGRRKGFGLYKDARRGIDNVLAINANNLRARVAHAWIDYAVDTRVPFGFKWILGGGDRKRALKNMREAAAMKGGHWEQAEASFGLWEMLVAEKMTTDALAVARQLIVTFPDNEELQRFVASGGTKKPPLP